MALFILLSGAVLGCGGKNISGEMSETVVFYDLPEIHVPRTADPSSETVLRISIGFPESTSLRQEIELKEADLKQTIAVFGSGMEKEDLTDVNRYEKLRQKIQEKLNGRLSRGGIVKVLFRKIDIK